MVAFSEGGSQEGSPFLPVTMRSGCPIWNLP